MAGERLSAEMLQASAPENDKWPVRMVKNPAKYWRDYVLVGALALGLMVLF